MNAQSMGFTRNKTFLRGVCIYIEIDYPHVLCHVKTLTHYFMYIYRYVLCMYVCAYDIYKYKYIRYVRESLKHDRLCSCIVCHVKTSTHYFIYTGMYICTCVHTKYIRKREREREREREFNTWQRGRTF